MAPRSIRVLAALGAVLVALVLSHSIVYLARYGSAYGEALAHNGHDLAWTLAVLSAGVLGGGLTLAALIQLARLGRAAGAAGTAAGPLRPTIQHGIRSWLLTAGRLAAVTAVLLTVQENVERAAVGLPLPGVGLLVSPEFPFALAIVVGISFAVAFVVTLFRRRREALLARLRTARLWARDISPSGRPSRVGQRATISALGAVRGLRAPPLPLHT